MQASPTPAADVASSSTPKPFALPPPPPSVAALPTTSVWLETAPLSSLTSSINLGQGFPDWSPPSFLLSKPSPTALNHQYARPAGDATLTTAIAAKYSPTLSHALNSLSNILVTVGASHALALALSALAPPGAEVILLEPAFDLYTNAVLACGARPVYVPLRLRPPAASSKDIVLDVADLAAAFSEKTRVLVLNTPHNPTGKVFSRAELLAIERVLASWPHVVVISDEVYEHMTFDPALPHVPFASLSDDAFSRTVSIYSAGKTFSATGWKIGWAIAPAPIISRLHALHQNSVFCVATPLQRALATGLEAAARPYGEHPTYYAHLAATYRRKRDLFLETIAAAPGLEAITPDGAFFVMTRYSTEAEGDKGLPDEVDAFIKDGRLVIEGGTRGRKDYNFNRRMAIDKNVVGIPPSAFYCPEHAHEDLAANFIRFAFCKEDAVLEEAKRRLCG